MTDKIDAKEVGKRLKAIRFAAGYGEQGLQAAWAQLIGVIPQTYNNWERGGQRVTLPAATTICQKTGATLDYIYLGKRETLPLKLSLAIDEVFAENAFDSRK